MKNLLVICTLLLLISCGKEDTSDTQKFATSEWDVKNVEVSVFKDCTGSYLQFKGKNYLLCNLELVDKYDTGAKIHASFKRVNKCKKYWGACMMVGIEHESGYIYATIH